MLDIIEEYLTNLHKKYQNSMDIYCIQFWVPSDARVADMFEGIQRSATKIIQSKDEYKMKKFRMFFRA